MSLKEYLKIYVEDKNKFKVLCICLLLILIFNQINERSEIMAFERDFTLYQCYGQMLNNTKVKDSFNNRTIYLNITPITGIILPK